MKITLLETITRKSAAERLSWGLSLDQVVARTGVWLVILLAAVLRFANLDTLGYVNHYYSAAMVSMLKSWHNFFFLAAEPGGAVSVDKPPLGLWLQAISSAIFGVNTLGVLLPEILAGLASILVLYHLVRRSFGVPAGLIAGLCLAVTPIVIATDRNNTMDSLLILTLLLAVWAFLKATETRQMRFLWAGAALVGLGFNIKMLEAFLPLPALYGLYLSGAGEALWKKIGKLAAASMLLAVISLSWVTIVDLTPASQRPYIGSSGDNTELSLITGYNGLDRLNGLFSSSRAAPNSGRSNPPGGFSNRAFPANPGGFGRGNQGGFPGSSSNGSLSVQAGNSGTATGSVDTGRTGVLRLWIPPLSKNASWLLPFACLSALFLALRGRLSWPFGKVHQMIILWGGWLLTAIVFFSDAQFFHEYYLSILGAPLAALVGLGIGQVFELRRSHRWFALFFLAGAAAVTVAYQAFIASPYISSTVWLPSALLFLLAGAVLWGLARQPGPMWYAGSACLVIAVLVAPGLWSALSSTYPSQNQSLPAVYSGQKGESPDLRGLNINPALLEYLQANTQAGSYLLAVPSSMQGSDYVIATGRPVLYLGGFMGIDPVADASQLAQWTQQGKLRFIYWDINQRSGMGTGANQAELSSWIRSSCRVVPGFDAATQNSGAPGGIGGTTNSAQLGIVRGFGGMQVSLYDCASSAGT